VERTHSPCFDPVQEQQATGACLKVSWARRSAMPSRRGPPQGVYLEDNRIGIDNK
jgi:hypothetical protein